MLRLHAKPSRLCPIFLCGANLAQIQWRIHGTSKDLIEAWRRERVTEGLVARAADARRAFQYGGGRHRREALKGEEVQAGRRGDKRGRWALEKLLEVRRGRGRGRGLEVRVWWSGGDATGRSWEDSCRWA